jgi:hypothetical protein
MAHSTAQPLGLRALPTHTLSRCVFMFNSSTTRQIPAEIRSLLRALRWRIRTYVWLDGLLAAALWLGLTFWAVLALDYFPVLLWASELSREVRAVLLLVVGLMLAAILYRRILARSFVRMSDRSMAILLERRYPEFADSLVTTVELARRSPEDAEFSPEMLEETRRLALARVPAAQLGPIFRRRPLLLGMWGVIGLSLSLAAFAAVNRSAFELGLRRVYLLSDETWPRRADIEIVGLDIERISPRTGELSLSETLPFVDGQVKVARGTNAILRVRANADAPRVPDYCRIYYRLADGPRGVVNMRRDGSVGDDRYQLFSFSGKPFQAILEGMQFDVVGYDHRLRNYQIEVVETPAVIRTVLECEFPSYLADPDAGLWMPREMDYRSSGTQLPQGTNLVIRMTANKDLQRVEFVLPDSGEVTVWEVDAEAEDRRTFTYEVPSLDASLSLEVSLYDTDNILTETPHRLFISALEDSAPRVDVYVRGIGSAVTPDVMLPAQGEIQDDYAVDRAWFEFQVNDRPARQEAIPVAPNGQVASRLDMRELRSTATSAPAPSGSSSSSNHAEASEPAGPLQLEPGDRLSLQIRAQDRYDLGADPNIGSSPRLDLEVVTPDELLIRLDRRELAERRRFEHIIDEMLAMRDSLVRVQDSVRTEELETEESAGGEGEGAERPAGAGEVAETVNGEEVVVEEDGRVRLAREQQAAGIDLPGLQIQQAQRQSEKSADEVLGVAAAFRAIREELVNNRVDAEDRQSRLENRVAIPLRRIGQERFPELHQLLRNLEKARENRQNQIESSAAVLAKTNEVLDELNAVLEAMLDIESYNELIDIVRSLIDDQQRIQDETRRIRRRAVRDLLD